VTWSSINFNAKDAKGIRKGTQRRPCSATFAQNFATFAVEFDDSVTPQVSFDKRSEVLGYCQSSATRTKQIYAAPTALVAVTSR